MKGQSCAVARFGVHPAGLSPSRGIKDAEQDSSLVSASFMAAAIQLSASVKNGGIGG